MPNRPGMNHLSMVARSAPACSQLLSQSEKKQISRENKTVMETLMTRDAEATAALSVLSAFVLTYLT